MHGLQGKSTVRVRPDVDEEVAVLGDDVHERVHELVGAHERLGLLNTPWKCVSKDKKKAHMSDQAQQR